MQHRYKEKQTKSKIMKNTLHIYYIRMANLKLKIKEKPILNIVKESDPLAGQHTISLRRGLKFKK